MHVYSYLLPLAGILADVAVIATIVSARRRSSLDRPLLLFYSLVGVWNSLVFLLLLAPEVSSAKRILFVVHNVVPFIQFAFFWVCLRITGRSASLPLGLAMAGALLIAALAHYSFWFTAADDFFIAGVRRFAWGYYPLHGTGSQLFEVYSVALVASGLTLLFRTGGLPERIRERARRVRWLWLGFWAALATNYLPVWGVDILPVGSAADAVFSVIIVLRLYGGSASRAAGRNMRLLAEAAGALAFAVLAGYAATEILQPTRSPPVFPAIVAAAATLTLHRFIFRRRTDEGAGRTETVQEAFERTLRDYCGLTPAEIEICIDLAEGHDRVALANRQQIGPEALELHLESIYSKTIVAAAGAADGDSLLGLRGFLLRLRDNTGT